ncbi:hypothetical protein [Desulfofustis glycolicus]|nr:hypothetical protein [Desulfofustis glycolicus]MCB2215820.1 hypothetical protein [Desulfobulbaceae bacterium]
MDLAVRVAQLHHQFQAEMAVMMMALTAIMQEQPPAVVVARAVVRKYSGA